MTPVWTENKMIPPSRLIFGTISLIGMSAPQGADLLLHAYGKGITFWEGSHDYGTYPHMSAALKLLTRERVAVVTKTYANTDAEANADVQDCLHQLPTDYIDVLLLHYSRPEWLGDPPRLPDSLRRQKLERRIHLLGIATHSARSVHLAAHMDDVEVIEAIISKNGRFRSHKDESIGYLEDGSIQDMYAALAKAHAAGKFTIGMKVLGNGLHSATAAQEIRTALELPFVDVLCIGMRDWAQIDQNTSAAEVACR